MNQDDDYDEDFNLPKITPELMSLVLKDVMDRLTGKRKWSNDTLEQIVLNKYTILKLKKEKGKD